jgi:hypothetical protein
MSNDEDFLGIFLFSLLSIVPICMHMIKLQLSSSVDEDGRNYHTHVILMRI